MVDLFWLTMFGLGLVLGGLALIRKVLQLGEGIMIGFLILSSTAFAINFALSLWQIRRLAIQAKEARGGGQTTELDTNELGPARTGTSLEPAPSVTENTTRGLEASSRDQITG